jgi:monoterpene epsilon-lactone hydrolase
MTASHHRMITWCPDYRMPPLHPSQQPSTTVWRSIGHCWLRDPADIFVGGASAGGNLAAALLLRARDEGLPMPAALVLPTPMVEAWAAPRSRRSSPRGWCSRSATSPPT